MTDSEHLHLTLTYKTMDAITAVCALPDAETREHLLKAITETLYRLNNPMVQVGGGVDVGGDWLRGIVKVKRHE